MDVALIIKFIALMLLALLMILIVKRFKIEEVGPWDYVFLMFAGPLWPIIFPALIIYLGVYHVKRYH